MLNSPTLRVGIVGAGFMGNMHAHAYRSLGFYYDPPPAQIELAGVSAQSEASVAKAKSRWGVSFGTTDFRELCQRDEIDIIHVCVPNHLHHDVLMAALEAGKHVYMDKPLARTLVEARAMADAAAQKPNCITQMTFQYRFWPAVMRAKQLIEDGALGRVFSVRAAYLHGGYVDPKRPFSWRLDAEKVGAGGALYDLGSHVIDLTRYLLGEFAEVLHQGHTFIDQRPDRDDPNRLHSVFVDDLSLMLLRLKSGAMGSVESSRVAHGVQDELRFEAHGDKGAIRLNLMQPNFLDYYDGTQAGGDLGGNRGFQQIECVSRYPQPAKWPGPKNTIGWERFQIHAIYSFINQVLAREPATPDIADGAQTQAVLESAIESAHARKWIDVPTL